MLDRQALARADGHRAGDRLDVEHEAWLSVRGRPSALETAPLSDGEGDRPGVLAELDARLVDDRTRGVGLPLAELLAQPAGVVSVGDEADVVAVRLVGDQQAASRRLLAHLRLRRV